MTVKFKFREEEFESKESPNTSLREFCNTFFTCKFGVHVDNRNPGYFVTCHDNYKHEGNLDIKLKDLRTANLVIHPTDRFLKEIEEREREREQENDEKQEIRNQKQDIFEQMVMNHAFEGVDSKVVTTLESQLLSEYCYLLLNYNEEAWRELFPYEECLKKIKIFFTPKRKYNSSAQISSTPHSKFPLASKITLHYRLISKVIEFDDAAGNSTCKDIFIRHIAFELPPYWPAYQVFCDETPVELNSLLRDNLPFTTISLCEDDLINVINGKFFH